MSCITLLTDFGARDFYAGAVKGVIHTIAPDVKVIDISHDIRPHDIVRAAFMLRQIWSWYPPDTTHLVIVDPGVGSDRRILAGRYGGQYVVAPDNGLISMVHHEVGIEDLRVVENGRLFLTPVSPTFHGRDIMAPVAAHLAHGRPLRDVGRPTDHLEVLQMEPPAAKGDAALVGRVLFVDRFCNLVTNIHRRDVGLACRQRPEAQVYVNGHCVGPVRTCYADVAVGTPLALIGGSEYLEVSVNRGRASEVLGCGASTQVEVR